MSKPNAETSDKQVQTIIRCFPHVLLNPEDTAKVSCDRACQTAVSTSPQTENFNFYGLLEYIPYQVIVEDSIKALDLPRKAFLQWNLPSSQSEELRSGSIEISESSRNSKHGSDSFQHKSALKKLSSSTDQLCYTNRLVLHQTMQKNYTSQEAQTVLSVLPHVLESDEVANVYTEFATQTSITCLPNSSITNILPQLKANLTHAASSTQTENDIGSAKFAETDDNNLLYEGNQDEENVRESELGSKSDQLSQEETEPLESHPEPEAASEEIDNVELDKSVQNNQSSTSNFSSQPINQESDSSLTANQAFTQELVKSVVKKVTSSISSQTNVKPDIKTVKPPKSNCKCHTEVINKIANKMRVQAATLQLTPKVFPSTTKFEERMADVLNTTIAILQTEMAKLMEVYIEDESSSTCLSAINSIQEDPKLCICKTFPENKEAEEKSVISCTILNQQKEISKISTTREVFDSSKTAPCYTQENVLEETTKRTIVDNENETVIEENIRRTIVRGKTPEPELSTSDVQSINISSGPYPCICGPESLPNDDVREEFAVADETDTMLDDTTPPFEYSEVTRDDTLSEDMNDVEDKTINDDALSSEESETLKSPEGRVTINQGERASALAPVIELISDEMEVIPSTSVPLTETGDYKDNKRFISIPCECHPTAAGAAPPTVSLDDLPPVADVNTDNAESAKNIVGLVTDSQPETTVKFELLMKKSINNVASVSAESAIVVRATISSPNVDKQKKENVKSNSSLPDLRDQVIRLSVIYKNGPEPETKVEELCTPVRTTQIHLSSREIAHTVHKAVSVTESFIQNTLYDCANFASTIAKPCNTPIDKKSSNVLSETSSNRTVVENICVDKKVSNLRTDKKDSGFRPTVSYYDDSKSLQNVNKNCKCTIQRTNIRMDKKSSVKSICSAQQTNVAQSSIQNTKSGQALISNAEFSKNDQTQDPDSLTCECDENSYALRPDVIVLPVPSFKVVKNTKLSYATFQNNYIPSTVCNCQYKTVQDSFQQTTKSTVTSTNYLFSSPTPVGTHSETDSSMDANLEIRVTSSSEENSKENTLNDLSLTYEEDTVYEEPYMETLMENDILTRVATTTADKLDSDSLDSFTKEDDTTNQCTCKTEIPWGRINLPSPGTYKIKPVKGHSQKENRSNDKASKTNNETPPPAEPGPVSKRTLKNREKLLYEDELVKHNEPYMEGLYKDFPNSEDDDDDGNCDSKTEIPWKDILLPEDCQIKSVKKTKKCMCRSNVQTLSNMLLSNTPQKELQTSIETVKFVPTEQQTLINGNTKMSYCSSGVPSHTTGNKVQVSRSDGAEQLTCQTYNNLSKQTAEDISSSIIVNIKSSVLSFSTSPMISSINETDTLSDILKDISKERPKVCIIKKSNSASAICGKDSINVKVSLKELTKPNNNLSKKASLTKKQTFKNSVESEKQNSLNVREDKCIRKDISPVMAALNAYEAEMKPLRDTLTTLQKKIQNLNMLEKAECKCITGINSTKWNFTNTRLTSSKVESDYTSSGSSFKPYTGFSTYNSNTTNAYTYLQKSNFCSTSRNLNYNNYLRYSTLPTYNQGCAPSIQYIHPVRYQQTYKHSSTEFPLQESEDKMLSNYASPRDNLSSAYNSMHSKNHTQTCQNKNLTCKDSYASNHNNKYKTYYSESPNKTNKQKHKARQRVSLSSARNSSNYDYHSSDSSDTEDTYQIRANRKKDDNKSKQKWVTHLTSQSRNNSHRPKSSFRSCKDYFDETILRSGQAVKTDPDDFLIPPYQPKKK